MDEEATAAVDCTGGTVTKLELEEVVIWTGAVVDELTSVVGLDVTCLPAVESTADEVALEEAGTAAAADDDDDDEGVVDGVDDDDDDRAAALADTEDDVWLADAEDDVETAADDETATPDDDAAETAAAADEDDTATAPLAEDTPDDTPDEAGAGIAELEDETGAADGMPVTSACLYRVCTCPGVRATEYTRNRST